jgi:hypothetical protein
MLNGLSLTTDMVEAEIDKMFSNFTFPGLKKTIADVVNLVNKAKGEYIKCARTGLAISGGAACLSCEPDWTSYYAVSSNTLDLATDTCSHLWAGCSRTIDNLQALKNLIATAVLDGLKAGGGDVKYEAAAEVVLKTPLCNLMYMAYHKVLAPPSNFNCQLFVCSEGAHGLFMSPLVTGDVSAELALGPVPQIARMVESIVDVHRMLAAAPAPTPTHTPTPTAAPVKTMTVAYTSQGYDAYQVGCTVVSCVGTGGGPGSGSDGKRFSAVGGLPGFVAICLGSALVIAVALTLIVKANRRSPQPAYPNQNPHTGHAFQRIN